jgi:hypothetical protein
VITLQDQVVEARRELALRRKLYPKWVKRGDLTESEAVYFIKAQKAIIATPRQLDMDQKQLHLFREEARPF